MRAGKNDRLFDIEQPKSPETRTASGAVVKEWETFQAAVWGQFIFSTGNELYGADAFNVETIFQVNIRPIPGVTNKMRLVTLDGRVFDILAVDDLGSRAQTSLKVKFGKSKGS